MGEDGLISKTKQAVEKNKIAGLEEKLQLETVPSQLDNAGNTTLTEYIEKLKQKQIIDDSNIEIVEFEKEVNIKLEDKYIFVVKKTENGGIKVEYKGKEEQIKPLIRKITQTNTPNTIKVVALSNSVENYEYFIKENGSSNYISIGTNKTGEFTYTGLTSGKSYDVKIVATNENGTYTKERTGITAGGESDQSTNGPTAVTLTAGEVSNKKVLLTATAYDDEAPIVNYKFYMNGYVSYQKDTQAGVAKYEHTTNFGKIEAYVLVEDALGKTKKSETIIIEDNTIETAGELKLFRDNVNNGNTYEGKTIKQTANINLNGNESDKWQPIGDVQTSGTINAEGNYFKGTYDGQNHIISGIYINNTVNYYNALFSIQYGTIKNLEVSGTVIGRNYSAGIAGQSFGTISNCINNCTVTGVSQTAGIVARNYNEGIVYQCINKGNITGSSTSSYEDLGGITALNRGMIDSCVNQGTIKGVSGGIMGFDMGGITGEVRGNGTVQNCYNSGSVTATKMNRVGGIIGWMDTTTGTVKNCYNRATVSANSPCGSVIGDNTTAGTCRDISNVYYLSGTNSYGIATGTVKATVKTSEELKALAQTLGENFKEDTNNINGGYPILTWQ